MSVCVSFVSEGEITVPSTVIVGHLVTLMFIGELRNGILDLRSPRR
jgi:hypothetical protein